MQSHLQKFSLDITRLEGLIQVQEATRLHNWNSEIPMKEINNIFDSLNKTLDEAEKLIESPLKRTRLSFKVPKKGLPNEGMWEGLSCFFLDKLTKAMTENHQEDYESAVYDLIDIGRTLDRELDKDYDMYELRDDDNRARNIYGDICDDTAEFNADVKAMLTCRDELDVKNHDTPQDVEKIHEMMQNGLFH